MISVPTASLVRSSGRSHFGCWIGLLAEGFICIRYIALPWSSAVPFWLGDLGGCFGHRDMCSPVGGRCQSAWIQVSLSCLFYSRCFGIHGWRFGAVFFWSSSVASLVLSPTPGALAYSVCFRSIRWEVCRCRPSGWLPSSPYHKAYIAGHRKQLNILPSQPCADVSSTE